MWPGKRLAELIGVLLLLPVWGPILALTCAAVWVVDGSPLFFRQQRRGLGGESFTLLKFRTMRVDPGRRTSRVESSDPSVTRLGRFLRSSKVDEVPQLLQVLTGTMALVGPRPLPDDAAVSLLPGSAERLRVRPGMTGLAQVCGGIDISSERRLELDLAYIHNASAGLDLRILGQTVFPWLKLIPAL